LGTRSVEVLTAYSHTPQVPDLRLRHRVAPVGTETPWNLRERLGEAKIQAIIDARRGGDTSIHLAAAYNVSLSSVKRLLRASSA
jgi:hypothetical protein